MGGKKKKLHIFSVNSIGIKMLKDEDVQKYVIYGPSRHRTV